MSRDTGPDLIECALCLQRVPPDRTVEVEHVGQVCERCAEECSPEDEDILDGIGDDGEGDARYERAGER